MNGIWTVEPGRPATLTAPPLADMEGALTWLGSVHEVLRTGLGEYGAVYVSGLPVHSVEDFARVRDLLLPQPTPYREKATPRSDFGGGVYSSTDLPAAQPIALHNENSYTLTFPGLLLFGCLTAPEQGGATPVADCREVLRGLPAHLVERMRAQGWLLKRAYSDHISTDWRSAFAADCRADVERYCAENLISCTWDEDGNLRTTQLRPGILRHPATDEEVWFNHLAFWSQWSLDEELRETLVEEFGDDGLPFDTAFGEGPPLTRDELDSIRAAYEAATVRRAWEAGGLLLVDNVLAAHGRDPFRGERRIVVAMGAPVQLTDCWPTVEAAAHAPQPAVEAAAHPPMPAAGAVTSHD